MNRLKENTYPYRNEHIAVLLSAVLFTVALLTHAGTAIADKGDFSLYVGEFKQTTPKSHRILSYYKA